MKKQHKLSDRVKLGVGLGLLAIGGIIGLWPRSITPEQAKESVVVIDTAVESEPSLFFFFSRFMLPLRPFHFQMTDGIASKEPTLKRIIHYGGTGFFVDGHLITAAHVVVPDSGEKVASITVTSFRGERVRAVVSRSDKAADLAELLIADGSNLSLPTLRLAHSAPRVGDAVFQIGHPGLIHYVISLGIIVGFDTEQGYNIATLDTFGGNSGGPTLNSRGQVIGVCHTILRGSRFTGIGTFAALQGFLYPEEVR